MVWLFGLLVSVVGHGIAVILGLFVCMDGTWLGNMRGRGHIVMPLDILWGMSFFSYSVNQLIFRIKHQSSIKV